MRGLSWIPAASLLAAAACGGRLLPLAGDRDAGSSGLVSADSSVDGGDDGDDGTAPDGRGPPPVPLCSGANAACLPPDAGIVQHGAAVIKCQPEEYVGPWTLLLERMIGTSFQVVQTQVVQEPGFGATFDDTNAPPSQLSYRVCSVNGAGTPLCGRPFVTQGAPNCGCEPTSCFLQTACNTTLDDWCGQTLKCGACSNGTGCNPENNSCCAIGFMSNGFGGCECAPPYPKGCPRGEFWNTDTCSCQSAGG